MVGRRHGQNRVHVGEIIRIGLGKVIIPSRQHVGEGQSSVEQRSIVSAARVGKTKCFHPQGIEAVGGAVVEVGGGIGLVQVHDQGMRRIAHHQKGHVILIHQITAVGAGHKGKALGHHRSIREDKAH